MTRRRILPLLPIGLLLLTVAEIAVFLWVAHAVGAGWAILAAAVSSVTGLLLLRREGIRGWRAFQAEARAGRPAGAQVSNSLIGLAGALLLAVPGFVTAVAGLLLVLPPGRIAARRGVQRFTEKRVTAAVADDLFGRKYVDVTVGTPDDTPRPPAPRPVAGEIVEGEIVR